MNEQGQTICLNMIVKNEAPVIRRCLDSVRPIIDYWVIVDTGSTDGTQQIIRKHLKELQGELIERPWVDFAHNRSEALERARGRGDYVFVIDADEILEITSGFKMPHLTADSYNVEVHYGSYSYLRKQLVKNTLPWCYKGVLHEYIHCEQSRSELFLPGLRTVPFHDGARARDPQTYRRDALTLERALLDEPNNTRYMFYLAQSYKDAGDFELALRYYKKRVEMGGWGEEVWYSLYQIAQIRERSQQPWPDVMESYLAAFQFKPDRAGPLYRIGMRYQAKSEFQIANLFFARAMKVPYPSSDRLFVERSLYQYLLPVEYAVSSFYVGDHSEAIETNNRLLQQGSLPAHAIEQVVRNRRYSLDALFPKNGSASVALGPIKICVPFRDPGPEFDDCVESIFRQELEQFKAVFIDDGSRENHAERIPLEDARFSLIRQSKQIGSQSCIERFLSEHCDPDEIIVTLMPCERFADREALTHIRDAFRDTRCMLAYGQHRLSTGELGNAMPAPNDAAFLEQGIRLASRSPLIFRAMLFNEARTISTRSAPKPDSEVTPPAPEPGLFEALHRSAGFNRTRFLDTVLTQAGAIAANGQTSLGIQASENDPAPGPSPDIYSPDGLPKISCLMVTRDRLALAKRSILSFAKQTYANRELVIVTDGEERFRRSLERFVSDIHLAGVRFVYPGASSSTLGQLRNMSMDAASGEIICQWDDDDYSHPDRLAIQVEYLLGQKARACFMTDHLQFLEDKRTLFWIDWTVGGRISGKERLVPGTMMMFKDAGVRYPEDGQQARQGEDSVLLESLYSRVPVAELGGKGYLYLYQFHGRNTFSKEHHYRMSSCAAPASFLQENASLLQHAVAHYPIPKPVIVMGRDQPAYVLNT